MAKKAKKTKKTRAAAQPTIVESIGGPIAVAGLASAPSILTHAPRRCEECRVEQAFHSWNHKILTPSPNWFIDFTTTVGIPAGKRAVIELVTARIHVPSGERARLRMFTSLGHHASNLDFVLTPQGQSGGREMLVATHSVRAYSDRFIRFLVNRDNGQTEGYALICISGYFVDV